MHEVRQKLNNWHLGAAARSILLLGYLFLCLSQLLY
jgi:hypothetical protein